jgi:hypothetical protein
MKAFKYLPPERIDVLQNQTIRFSQPQYLNDGFEALPYVSGLESPQNINHLFDQTLSSRISGEHMEEQLAAGIQEVLKQAPGLDMAPVYKLLNSVSPDKWLEMFVKPIFLEFGPQATVPNSAQTFRKGLEDKIGVLSLTSRNDHLSMWAYYAKDNQGFVIQFNDQGQLFENSKSQFQCLRKIAEVRYEETRPEIFPFSALSQTQEWVEEFAIKVFLTKSSSWAHEEELRVVKGLQECTPKWEGSDIHLYSFNAEEVSNIYLGTHVNSQLEEDVQRLLKQPRYRHVNLYRSVLSDRHYGIEFIEINR